jgi:hypothetical protein
VVSVAGDAVQDMYLSMSHLQITFFYICIEFDYLDTSIRIQVRFSYTRWEICLVPVETVRMLSPGLLLIYFRVNFLVRPPISLYVPPFLEYYAKPGEECLKYI